jgi:hypothetical protein
MTSTTTNTSTPSATSIHPTPTYTPAPTQTATPTPLSTLAPEEAEEFIRNLLQDPRDCLAPCFWGIIPGQTSLEEAINRFAHLGLPLQFTNARDNKEFYESIYDFRSGLSISPLLTVQNKIVKNLRIYITPEKSEPGLPRQWLAYSPETLIDRCGLPSQVDFFVDRIRDGNVPQRTWYHMVLYFPAVDLIIEYSFAEIFPEDQFRACPLTDGFQSVTLWLGKDPEQPPFDGLPVEEATDMTLDEFSRLMARTPENACFELNVELFP